MPISFTNQILQIGSAKSKFCYERCIAADPLLPPKKLVLSLYYLWILGCSPHLKIKISNWFCQAYVSCMNLVYLLYLYYWWILGCIFLSSLLSLLKCTEVFYARFMPPTSISTAAPLEFKINFQLENGNLWICIMSFFNENNIEVYSWRFIATMPTKGEQISYNSKKSFKLSTWYWKLL